MTDIGELVVRIKADAAQLQQEMQKANGTLKQSSQEMSSSLGVVGEQIKNLLPLFTAAAIVEFGKNALESADSVYEMSERIGFAASTLSALNIPLKQNGSSVEEFSAAVNILNRNIGLAATGNQEMIQKFDQLGLSVSKLKAMKPEDAFFAVVEALGQTKDQFELANNARDLFGRGVAGLIPLIKETGGNLRDFADNAKKAGDALTDEQIEKVHQFEAAWVSALEHMKIGVVDFLTYFYKLGEETDDIIEGTNPNLSYKRPQTVGVATTGPEAAKGIDAALRQRGLPGLPASALSASGNPAAGSNADLTPKQPEKDPSLEKYIAQLKEEADASDLSSKALFVKRAELEANTKAESDYSNQLRTTKTLTDDEMQQVDQAAAALYDHKQALEENKKITDELANSITNIITNFKNMKSAVTDLLNSIAQEIIKSKIAQPLSESLTSLLPSFSGGNSIFNGLGPLLGFASGGSPPVGVPSIVGENGPELFVPNTAGTIVPNTKLGGQSVIVQQTINLSPGLPETVNAAVMNAAPSIAAAAHASVIQAFQKGGSESKIVGLPLMTEMPSYPNFTTCRFGLETNTQTFTSPLTKAVQRMTLGGSRWTASFSLPAMTRAQAAVWKAFFDSLEGQSNTFNAFDPDCKTPRGTATGTPLANGSSQTGSSLITDGWTANITALKAGDYFSVNAELKRMTADAIADGSGNATLNFKPALRSPADNTAIITNRPTCTMILADDMQALFTCNANGIYQPLTFAAFEVFS